MKRGTAVAVCHDGKWGRRVKGVVVATRQGHHIKVAFTDPENNVVEFWARLRPTIRYQKLIGHNSYRLDRYKNYGGWAEVDTFFPWYGVYKWPKKEENAQ